MARSAKAVASAPVGAYSPAPDTAPAVAAAPAAGPDMDTDHPVVHRPHAATAPFQP